VDDHRSGNIKDYNIDICCSSAKHASLMNKSKNYVVQIYENVSEWSDMSSCGMGFH